MKLSLAFSLLGTFYSLVSGSGTYHVDLYNEWQNLTTGFKDGLRYFLVEDASCRFRESLLDNSGGLFYPPGTGLGKRNDPFGSVQLMAYQLQCADAVVAPVQPPNWVAPIP
ncbi:hypothetical protein PG996_008758 [Apiospora saccharicola]|uniref:Uncharacterized protein n=1 Tax=Apiospora saccharicola TaxID=335842 RepID=A0ABR1UYV9_9PEZI